MIGSIDLSVDLSEKNRVAQKRKLFCMDDIVTCNDSMKLIKEKLEKIAKNDSPVMVIGESGTGKELIVESIHTHSNRCQQPFISLNCAAVPDALIESTLFGTVKGSFTGAENRKGLFELADKGTLFLDEINSMNIELQAKLLRVVEEQRYMKVGGEHDIEVDVRLVSAMNVSPWEAIEAKKLRQDLFYRLSVVQFLVPPLRKRREDIRPLAEHFVRLYNEKMNKQVSGINDFAMKVLQDHSWPGNVREFKNVMESAFNVVDGQQIRMIDLPDYLIAGSNILGDSDEVDVTGHLTQMVSEYEKKIIVKVLKTSTSLNNASAKLGITRQTLKYKIKKMNIDYLTLLGK